MKTIISKNKWWAVSGLAIAVIVFSAWVPRGNSEENFAPDNTEDTVKPRKKHYYRHEITEGDLDIALKGLETGMLGLDKSFRFDFSKIDKEMKAAMEEIKKIDFEKIGREIEVSMKSIDWDKTRVEMDKALKEAQHELKNVDMKKVKEEIAAAKEKMESHKILSESFMENLQSTIETSMAGARVGIEKAKKELSLLKEFIDTLEKDGLIDKKKEYKIKIKDEELYINGVKQSKEVNAKYKKYLEDREDITITSDEEGSSRI